MSRDHHVFTDLLEAVYERRTLAPEILLEIALDHCAALCRECDGALTRYRERHGRRAPDYGASEPRRPEPDERARRAGQAAAATVRRVVETRSADRRRVLRPVPAGLRRRVAQGLLAEARERILSESEEAVELTELAEELAASLEAADDLSIQALTFRAAARKARGDFETAGQLFALARKLSLGGDLPRENAMRTLALLDFYEGGYLKDRRRWDEAKHLLSIATAHFRALGAHRDAVFPLLTLGILHRLRDEHDEAFHFYELALADLDPERDPRLYLQARHNLALCAVELGDFETAKQQLVTYGALYDRFSDPWSKLRRQWLEARIAHGERRRGKAETLFLAARDAALEMGHGYDAALITLDLAYLYASAGEQGKLADAAEGLPEILASNELHEEARAALLLFEREARRRNVEIGLLRQVARYLRLARTDPAFGWQEFLREERGF